MFPGASFLIGLATLSGLLFYLTSANSGAMVMSNFSASIPDPSRDGPRWLRIFWAVMFTGRMSREIDVYYRLEVFTQTGSGGYDLMGLTRQQVIDDVLDRYEAHLAFLTFSSENDTASVLTPPKSGRP
jgi:hypothetical protein